MLDTLVNAYRAGRLVSAVATAEPARALFEGRRPDIVIPEQGAYIKSRAMLNIVETSRRSGKTFGAVDRHVDLHAELPPGSWTHFGSLIKRNAVKHFWMPIQERFAKLGWRVRTIGGSTHMILKTERDTYIQVFGCDDERDTKVVQGDSSMLFTIDECHLPADNVLSLLVKVALPMLSDRGGMMDLLGLPPDVPGGFFDKAIKSGKWNVYKWTMFDHDFPRPREEKLAQVIETCRATGEEITVDMIVGPDGRPRYTPRIGETPESTPTKKVYWTHPSVLQQYFGVQSRDASRFAYEYQAGRNDYDPAAVDFGEGEWSHSAGLDLGWGDNDAIVINSWPRWVPEGWQRTVYGRWYWQANLVDLDLLSDVIAVVKKVFPAAWVGDTGGHGAVAMLNTLAGRLHMEFLPKPTDAAISCRVQNGDYRTGRLKHPTEDVTTPLLFKALEQMPWTMVRKEVCRSILIEGVSNAADYRNEIANVPRTLNATTGRLEINKKGKHSDISEANRYAHHASRHWTARVLSDVPTKTREQLIREHNAKKAQRRKQHASRD